MAIDIKTFGTLSNGTEAKLYTLKAGDLRLCLTNYGGILTSLFVPKKGGPADDILLGFSTLEQYTGKSFFFGVTVGRFANRIGGAKFVQDGKTYTLFNNDRGNTLHGGRRGFDRALWDAYPYESREGVFVKLLHNSPAGDEGFPGNLTATVRYGITWDNKLIADYCAVSDSPTPVNLTNHSYFNLAGEGSGTIMEHDVKLYASSYLEVDDHLIPTGKLIPVKGTPYDFTAKKPISKDAAAAIDGYDHCFAVDGEPGKLRPAAEVSEKISGRKMEVFTTKPGVQFYTGNSITGANGKDGSFYGKHSGFCLETQHFPDAPNKPSFLPGTCGPDKPYHESTEIKFTW